MLGFLAPALWLIWMFSQNEAFVWATSGSLLLSVGGGLVMFARTAQGQDPGRDGGDPADVRVAEKQIPGAALAAHGLIAAVLVGSVLLVGLGL